MQGFTVHRPCGDPRLWDALAFILALDDVVLYFPGCRAPLVTRSTVTQHLPSDMVDALGQPIVVTSGREIQHEIQAAEQIAAANAGDRLWFRYAVHVSWPGVAEFLR